MERMDADEEEESRKRLRTSAASSSSSPPPPPPVLSDPHSPETKIQKRGIDVEQDSDDSDDESDSMVEGEEKGAVPKYRGGANARKVFAKPDFYNGKKSVANDYRGERNEAIREGMTVRELRAAYEKKNRWIMQLASDIGADALRVEEYFDRKAVSVERLLADEMVVALNEGAELERFRERFVRGLPAFEGVRGTQTGGDRTTRLCFVTGTSGSGKSFFAMGALRKFLLDPDSKLPAVVLYLHAGKLSVGTEGIDFSDRSGAVGHLVEAIQRLLALAIWNKFQKTWDPRREKLAMHVCMVFDEASAHGLCRFFDDATGTAPLLQALSEHLAESVTMVVVGTGLLGESFDSKKEVYFFRMTQWGLGDLRKVLDRAAMNVELVLKAGESVETLTEAIHSHPLLAALATIGRPAYFLVKTIASLSRRFAARKEPWHITLGLWLPSLVDEIVGEYMGSNGIKDLAESERCRVAAWIFWCLASTRGENLPEFDGLGVKERNTATLLVQLNVQWVGKKIKLLPNENFPVTVSPAISIILFSMLGVTARMMSSWRSEEEVAALYAIRHWTLQRMQEYVVEKLQPIQKRFGRETETLHVFERRLVDCGTFDDYALAVAQAEDAVKLRIKNLRLFHLNRRNQRNDGGIWIPLVPMDSVLVNGDNAAFADVIAPYSLLQAKYSINPQGTLRVDLAKELGKAGLLNGNDDRILRGLVALWRGEFNDLDQRAPEMPGLPTEFPPTKNMQVSDAFPENLLKFRQATEPVDYGSVNQSCSISVDGIPRDLPELNLPDGAKIIFTIVTNVEQIKLPMPIKETAKEKAKEKAILVSPGKLDQNNMLDPGQVEDPELQAAWIEFQSSIRGFVQLKFLFTKQA